MDHLAVYEGSCGALACIAQTKANNVLPKRVAWNAKVGRLYKVYVAGFEDNVGDYNLTIMVRIFSAWFPCAWG